MAFVPGFDHDVFISYAALDNTSLPGQDGEWVARFHGSLSQRLRTLIGPSDLNVYRDPKLDGLDSGIALEQVQRAAVLIAVVSKAYLRSEFCLRELEAFSEANVGEPRRVLTVWLDALDRATLPPAIADLVAFNLWAREAGQDARRLSHEEPNGALYWRALNDLSHLVADSLTRLRRDAPQPQSDRGTVFLVDTADACDYGDRLRRALVQQGVTVLPEHALPSTRGAMRAVIEPDLRRSTVSVHLLGTKYGRLLDDGLSSAHAQAEMAAELARERPLRRVFWISPEASKRTTDERQRAFRHWAEIVDPPDDFVEGGFEELKSVVFETLEKASARTPTSEQEAVAARAEARPSAASTLPAPAAAPPSVVVDAAREVFISYSRADAAQFAVQLGEALGVRGVRVWIDVKHIRAGANFRRAIEEALYRCTHMLIVLSPKAVESDEVMGEVNVALDDKKPVVPVLYLPCRTPSYLRVRQHVNFSGLDANDAGAIASVVEALGVGTAAS